MGERGEGEGEKRGRGMRERGQREGRREMEEGEGRGRGCLYCTKSKVLTGQKLKELKITLWKYLKKWFLIIYSLYITPLSL